MTQRSKYTLLIILAILFASPFMGQATDVHYLVKEFTLDPAARLIARTVFQNLSQSLVSQIQGKGRDGGPAFVTNWRNFETDAQYRGEDIFRVILASSKLCGYIDDEIKNIFGAKTKIPLAGINTRVGSLESFGSRVNCTLPQGFDLAKYQKDFKGNGGWQVFSRLSEPQNNYYGVLLESLNELGKQSALEVSADLNEALANDGFLSARKGRAGNDSCQGRGANAKCVVLGNVVTPGKLLGETVANTIDQDLNWLVSSDEISEVMIAVVNATISRLANLAESTASYPDPKLDEAQLLKEEYCTADKPSKRAISTYGNIFPGYSGGGTDSPCKSIRNNDNPYPYQQCVLACFKAVGAIPANISVPPLPSGSSLPESPSPSSAPTQTTNPTASPTPSPSTSSPTSLLSDLKAERDKYGNTLTEDEVGKLLNAVAWKNRGAGWVLLGKSSGANCPSPSGPKISCDFLYHKPSRSGFDVLIDSDSKATPTWQGPDTVVNSLLASGQRTLVDPIQP